MPPADGQSEPTCSAASPLSPLREPLLSASAQPPLAALQASAPARLEVRRESNKPEKKRRVVFVSALTAAAEQAVFPYDPRCMHCGTMTTAEEARWGSGLCDSCYGACRKECLSCHRNLALRQLHWNSGLCDDCYDAAKQAPAVPAPSSLPSAASLNASVRTIVGAQLVFYMAPAVMTPSLYLQVQECVSLDGFAPAGFNAASAYAGVLTTTTIVAMAAPIPFGMWAEWRGEREVYVGVTVVATLSALILALAPLVRFLGLGLPTFAFAWGCLSAPLSLRGVRAAFFARQVDPSQLSRVSQARPPRLLPTAPASHRACLPPRLPPTALASHRACLPPRLPPTALRPLSRITPAHHRVHTATAHPHYPALTHTPVSRRACSHASHFSSVHTTTHPTARVLRPLTLLAPPPFAACLRRRPHRIGRRPADRCPLPQRVPSRRPRRRRPPRLCHRRLLRLSPRAPQHAERRRRRRRRWLGEWCGRRGAHGAAL
jgi:hypothetical protein